MHESLPLCVEMPSPTGEGANHPRLWQAGATLDVRFLDGPPRLHAIVAATAVQWLDKANINFIFAGTPDAPIRITFAGAGLWAYIGTDALLVSPGQPTLGLGALDAEMDNGTLQSVILHMFGHVLGFPHTLPDTPHGIPWDEDRLYAYLARLYSWTKEQVATNILKVYGADSASHTQLDTQSIMTLPVPRELTAGGFQANWRPGLSDADRLLAASCYPLFEAMPATAALQDEPAVPKGLESLSTNVTPVIVPPLPPGPSASSAAPISAPMPAPVLVSTASAVVSATSLREERIRLDVATPAHIFKDEPFDLAVAVRQPDAPQIAIEDLPVVQSTRGSIFHTDQQEVIRYRIEVTGADCEVTRPQLVILLRPGENSEQYYFQVTVRKAGTRTLFVNAYQEDQQDGPLAAQTRLRIRVDLPVDERTDPASTPTKLTEITDTTDIEVIDAMDIELSPDEVEQFKEALKSAFQRGDLEQVVFFGLGVRMADIVTPSNYNNEVNGLVMWVNDNNRVADLLNEAREKNKGNVKLRAFADYVKTKWVSGSSPATPAADSLQMIVQQIKGQLVEELVKLPVTADGLGRANLLFGIPGADALNRQPGSQRADLDTIVIQLAQRGRLADGRLPLVILIDNALVYAAGYEGEATLRAIRDRLAQAGG